MQQLTRHIVGKEQMHTIDILAIIVTYQPESQQLDRLIHSLTIQVNDILIVDNASCDFSDELLMGCVPNLSIIRNEKNLGLATAYNQAIQIAREQSKTHVILFDQDSLPAPNMVKHLLSTMLQHNKTSLVAAAAGPKYTDIKGQHASPFVRIRGLHLERVYCAEQQVVEIDHLISSGSLIDMRAFAVTGAFTDDLFIDGIDTEWCLRARHHKLKLLGVGSARMSHSIGEQHLNILGRQIPLHPPQRLYYQFRNQVWLIKQPWVSWRWRIIDSIRLFKLLIVFLIFAPNKRANLYFITKGLRDGLLSQLGKMRS